MQLTLSGRYDRTTVDNEDNITEAGEPGSLTAKHRFSRFNPALGVTFNPSEALSGYLGYNEGSRAPSADRAGMRRSRRIPAGSPTPWPAIRRSTKSSLAPSKRVPAACWPSASPGTSACSAPTTATTSCSSPMTPRASATSRTSARPVARASSSALNSQLGPVYLGANYTYLDATYRSVEELLGEGNSTNEEGPGFEGTIEVEPGDRFRSRRGTFSKHSRRGM